MPTPRVGGIALLISLAAAGSFGWLTGIFSSVAWVSFGGLALLGILDDRFDLRAEWKALGSLIIGIVLAVLGTLELMNSPGDTSLFGCSLSGMPIVMGGLLLMLFWGVPQAFNLIDGADGLTLGFTLISLFFIAIAGIPIPYAIGSVLALFILNWPNGRIFLGDSGALCLGLLTSMLAFKAFGKTRPEAILWLFAYPIADVSQVVLTRLATGRPIWRADQNHFHHRWKEILGTKSYLCVPLLWLQASLCATGAITEGPWRGLSWIGVSGLVLQVASFILISNRNYRLQRKETRVCNSCDKTTDILRMLPPARYAGTEQSTSDGLRFSSQLPIIPPNINFPTNSPLESSRSRGAKASGKSAVFDVVT